jgi:hypothetical protein
VNVLTAYGAYPAIPAATNPNLKRKKKTMSPQPSSQSQPDLKLNSRVLALESGMYIFRYATELPEGQEVCITLQQAPLGKGTVDFFPAEGVSRNTLARLGDCVVIRVKGGKGAVLVTEYQRASQAVSVDLRVDRIDTSDAIARKAPVQQPPVLAEAITAPAVGNLAPAGQLTPVALSRVTPVTAPVTSTRDAAAANPGVSLGLEGHIERRGDVSVQNDWLGNPDGNARLEGFSINWPGKPQGVDLAYSCKVAGQGRQPAVLSGSFVGTRRKAAGIQAITFGLVGPQQKAYQLSGHVVFAGSPPQAIANGKELSGPTGYENLVAISVSITSRSQASPASAPRYESPWEDPTITQIYKAQG